MTGSESPTYRPMNKLVLVAAGAIVAAVIIVQLVAVFQTAIASGICGN